MTRHGSERLAALIDDPGIQVTPEDRDRDFVRLAGISRELAAGDRVEPDPQYVASLRVVLMAAAQTTLGGCSERSVFGSLRSRLHLWIVKLAVGVLTAGGIGISFASD